MEKKLYSKIATLQWMAVEISKSGKNEFAKYPYKKFSDIKKAIMVKMNELKLAILPVGEIKELNVGQLVSYIQPMAIIDAETNEMHNFEFPFIGKNTDADKASGSAITYALKYVLNLIALLPDESLDPDETETTKNVKNAKPSSVVPMGKNEPQVAAIDEKTKLQNELTRLVAQDPNNKKKLAKFISGDENYAIRRDDFNKLTNENLKTYVFQLGGKI